MKQKYCNFSANQTRCAPSIDGPSPVMNNGTEGPAKKQDFGVIERSGERARI